jgi:phosphomannomutase
MNTLDRGIGRIADNFTFAAVASLAQSFVENLKPGSKVVVGHDTRFQAGQLAGHAAGVLAANGLEVFLSKSFLPTSAFVYAMKHYQAAGLLISAPHQPAEYLGLSAFMPDGSDALLAGSAKPQVPTNGFSDFDIRKPYYDHLATLLDMETLKTYQGVIYQDSMGGASGGWMAGFAKHAKLGLELRELHAVPDPTFYGVTPDPLPENLYTLTNVLKAEENSIGIALSADASRVALVYKGQYFSPEQADRLLEASAGLPKAFRLIEWIAKQD